MLKAFVTGAGGFVGKYLVTHLQTLGYTVYAGCRNGKKQDFSDEVIPVSLDVTNKNAVNQIIREIKPSEVYHLAAISHPASNNFHAFYEVNLQGTLNILEAAKSIDCAILIVSSAYVYGRYDSLIKEDFQLEPVNHYGVSKAAADMLAYSYALQGQRVIRVRPFNHSGPGQPPSFLLPTLVEQLSKIEAGLVPPVIKLGNLDSVRDFMDVRDVVRAYPLLLKHGANGAAYNLCSGQATSVQQLFDLICDLSSVDITLEVESFRKRQTDIPYLVGDASKIKSVIDWRREIELKVTIGDMLDVLSQGELISN